MNELTHFSLFSGIGGMDLAAEWAGFRTVGQCERDPYCLQVLDRHFPEVPKFDDIHNLSADTLRDAGVERPTVLSGGFPCQPFSCAGKQRGKEDDRHLWPEMLRIVSELRPSWVIGENVPGIIGMALDDILAELEHCGYAARAILFPAAAVGALHRRDRCFIVAHDDSLGCTRSPVHIRQGGQEQTSTVSGRGGSTFSNPYNSTSPRQRQHGRKILSLTESEGSDLDGQHLPDPDEFDDDNSGHGTGEIHGNRSEKAEIFGDMADPSCKLPYRARETRAGCPEYSDRDERERERVSGQLRQAEITRIRET